MPLNEVDSKPGEKVISFQQVLTMDDSVFRPSTRPPLNEAIGLILGEQQGYLVPFASVPLKHHDQIEGQNLFQCLFGRDSLLIAELLKKRRPELQKNVVLALGSVQGKEFDSFCEEEPGRIAHEVREPDDPRAQFLINEGNWKFPYYGSVDATLIWLRSLGELASKELDLLSLDVGGIPLDARAILATEWILRRLQSPSGLIESHRSNPLGIQNQVWKDSSDSYMHHDGILAQGGSTASIETVGETYDALIAAAKMQEQAPSKHWPASIGELLAIAEGLRAKLFNMMWLGDRFALGTERNRDGIQVPLDSQASNQARLLDSRILDGEDLRPYREAIATAITDPDLLCETGLRTLAKSHVSYRAGGYHTGSAWPMDGVFAAKGLIKHGYLKEAWDITSRIKKSIESIGGYPEFFRADYPENGLISTELVDVVPDQVGYAGPSNRILQPPQLIQGWTVAAYAWLSDLEEIGI
jgi:glycogen debranching enzyme